MGGKKKCSIGNCCKYLKCARCSLSFFGGAMLSSMRDLSSLTKDQTCANYIGRVGLNHWVAREVSKYATTSVPFSAFIL